MRLAGMFLLLAGWVLTLCAIVLFTQMVPRAGFVLSGICLEFAGLALAFRGDGHWRREEQ